MSLKLLLIPFTIILYYCIAYLGIFLTQAFTVYMFSLSWIWIIIGYTFFMTIIMLIVSGPTSALAIKLNKLYNKNKLIMILHSIAGSVGIIVSLYAIYSDPPSIISGEGNMLFTDYMWDNYPVKTIFAILFFLTILVSFIMSTVVYPFVSEEDKN